MNTADLFRHKKPDFNKLEKFGFRNSPDGFIYKINFVNTPFCLQINVKAEGTVSTHLYDLALGDEYTLHLMPDVTGPFVAKVRTEYEEILNKVIDSCFETAIFKFPQTEQLIRYVQETYGDSLEHLWAKFPDCAIWRRPDNRKWYGVILTIQESKIGWDGTDKIEILDLRFDSDSPEHLIDYQHYFPAYHMNKKHWITIPLTGVLPFEEIKKRLDISHQQAALKR